MNKRRLERRVTPMASERGSPCASRSQWNQNAAMDSSIEEEISSNEKDKSATKTSITAAQDRTARLDSQRDAENENKDL